MEKEKQVRLEVETGPILSNISKLNVLPSVYDCLEWSIHAKRLCLDCHFKPLREK
jgi:hypothetical protein